MTDCLYALCVDMESEDPKREEQQQQQGLAQRQQMQQQTPWHISNNEGNGEQGKRNSPWCLAINNVVHICYTVYMHFAYMHWMMLYPFRVIVELITSLYSAEQWLKLNQRGCDRPLFEKSHRNNRYLLYEYFDDVQHLYSTVVHVPLLYREI